MALSLLAFFAANNLMFEVAGFGRDQKRKRASGSRYPVE